MRVRVKLGRDSSPIRPHRSEDILFVRCSPFCKAWGNHLVQPSVSGLSGTLLCGDILLVRLSRFSRSYTVHEIAR